MLAPVRDRVVSKDAKRKLAPTHARAHPSTHTLTRLFLGSLPYRNFYIDSHIDLHCRREIAQTTVFDYNDQVTPFQSISPSALSSRD